MELRDVDDMQDTLREVDDTIASLTNDVRRVAEAAEVILEFVESDETAELIASWVDALRRESSRMDEFVDFGERISGVVEKESERMVEAANVLESTMEQAREKSRRLRRSADRAESLASDEPRIASHVKTDERRIDDLERAIGSITLADKIRRRLPSVRARIRRDSSRMRDVTEKTNEISEEIDDIAEAIRNLG